MKILYISQYFPPEIGATQSRAYELCKNLVDYGHRVTVLTELPNHPSGIIPTDYRGKFKVHENLNGINVIRSWVYATPHKSFQTRMYFYNSFMLTTIFNSLFLRSNDYDIIYATSPPLFAGFAGLMISKIKNKPFVFEVRDLWPESAVELGQIRRNWAIKAGHIIANLCYRNAVGVVGVTRGIQKSLAQKRISQDKLFLIKNGTNPELFHYSFNSELQGKVGWKDKFIVLYAGIHGVAQGLDSVLRVAQMLADETKIHFVFIGEGPLKKRMGKFAKDRNINNVEFLPEVSNQEIPKYISLADVCLVPLKKKAIFRGALPSKIFDCWACGKPLILSVDGEARTELENAKGGIYVEPENSQQMERAIRYLYHHPDEKEKMGKNGLAYVHKKGYIRSLQAKKLSNILTRIGDCKRITAAETKATIPVLHIITRLIVGGAQENTLLTSQLLNKKNWYADILSGSQTGPEGSLAGYAKHQKLPLIFETNLVREIHPLSDIIAFWRIYRFIRSGKYPVVHTHSSKAGVIGRWAAWLARVPLILHTVHGWGFTEYQKPWIQRFYKYLERITLRITDKLIVVTRLDINKGLSAGIGSPEDYELIRSGIELERFASPKRSLKAVRKELGIPQDAVVIGTVTRLSPQKAPLVFVKAAQLIAAQYPKAHFVIVGDGPLREEVESMIQELGLSEQIHLTGLRSDVPDLLAAFDIFTLSSLWEGLPRVLPQAMAAGLPIVASAIDGSMEIINDHVNGRLFPPGDHAAMAQAIIDLIENPEAKEKMVLKGYETVREFDVNLMVNQIEDLYIKSLAMTGKML